jgi:type IV pilus assembly protein PilQ
MMSARLSSLLVAGGVVFAGVQTGFLRAEETSLLAAQGHAVLQSATLESGTDAGTVISLGIPGFAGTPRLQVLGHPSRIVLDLPGVARGQQPTRADLAAWSSPLIRKVRVAQFKAAPALVTRLVLEVAEGTQAVVSSRQDGVRLQLQPGEGAVQARLAPAEATVVVANEPPAAAPAAATTAPTVTVTPVVVAAAPAPKALDPIPAISAQPSVNLAVASLLPTTLTAQDKTAAVKRDEPRGRTLGDAQGRYTGSRITIDVKGAELSTFLRIIADHAKLNLVADQDVQGIYDFKFTDTPWDQVLDIIVKHAGLGMEINNGVIRVAKMEKLQKEEDDRKRLEEAKALAGDLTTVTRPLSFAKAAETKPIIEKLLTKRGSLIVDDRTNVLIISDLQKNLAVIDDLIQQLDVQIQQVQIEARVVEAKGGYEKAFGVKWPTSNSGDAKLTVNGTDASWITTNAPSWNSINSRPTGSTVWAGGFSGGKDGVTSIASPAGEFWVSFLSNRLSVNVILQALETEGKVRIVSNPKVVTQNNKKATILSGAKIPYPSQQGGASGGAITVAFADANLQLDVTPQITNDGTILMDLKIEKAEADFSQQVQGTPTILRKFIETQVLVKDGGTAVLGGIYTTSTSATTTGVPFLSKIPILGWLFRMKDNKEDNSELLIFITPRVLKM